MSDSFTPYKWRGLEKDLSTRPLTDGYIYFTIDTNKLFIDVNINGTVERKQVQSADSGSTQSEIKQYKTSFVLPADESQWTFNNNKYHLVYYPEFEEFPQEIFEPVLISCDQKDSWDYRFGLKELDIHFNSESTYPLIMQFNTYPVNTDADGNNIFPITVPLTINISFFYK